MSKALCDTPAMTTEVRRGVDGTRQGFTVSAATAAPGKWILLLGGKDEPAGTADTAGSGAAPGDADPATVAALRAFVSAVPGAEVMSAGDAPWMPTFDAAIARLAQAGAQEGSKTAALPRELADLPLIVVPARTGGEGPSSGGRSQWFGVFLTGDGGWVGLDKGVSGELAKHDIPIVGWDSLKYFWKRRTPDGASHDLDRVLKYYSHAWGRSHALLIGYSQGADTLPFMLNRLPAATHRLVGYTTLLGISDNALWEFHVATWLGNPPKGIPTAPELERWSGSPYLCIYGESDEDAACEQETGHDGTALRMSGGHHFGGGYDRIANEILSRLPLISPPGVGPAASVPDAAREPASR
jgi:type IV secretory pathway VirJ component